MRGPSTLPNAIYDLPPTEALALGVVLTTIADLRDPEHSAAARCALEDGSVDAWLNSAGLSAAARTRVSAHLSALAANPPAPRPPYYARTPPSLSPEQVQRARDLRAQGLTVCEIAEVLRTSVSSAHRVVRGQPRGERVG